MAKIFGNFTKPDKSNTILYNHVFVISRDLKSTTFIKIKSARWNWTLFPVAGKAVEDPRGKTLPYEIRSVSYTHLDVYKRQVLL